MSGPKISVYALSGWAQQVVMGQIRCEQQSVACAEQIRALIQECQSCCSSRDAILTRLEIFERRFGAESTSLADINNLFESAEATLNSATLDLQSHVPHISTKYQISDEAYEEKKRQLAYLQRLRSRVTKLRKELDETVNPLQNEQNAAMQSIHASIAEDLSGVYSFDFAPENTEIGFEDQKKAACDRLAVLAAQALSKETARDVRNAFEALERIHEAAHLSTFEAVTLRRLERSVKSERLEDRQRKEEFAEALSRYRALCQMADTTAEEFSVPDCDHVQNEIRRLEQVVYQQQEQASIYECVDEVMADMGYDLIGRREVKKRSGKRFRNELYTFGEGTAVNVTYSSDGQIAMELGGLAHQDRIPTAAEAEVLTADMESFCGEFAEFERRLLAKGVVVGNRIALLPPSAECASIININDYSIEPGAQVSGIGSFEKKKRTAAEKQMRRND